MRVKRIYILGFVVLALIGSYLAGRTMVEPQKDTKVYDSLERVLQREGFRQDSLIDLFNQKQHVIDSITPLLEENKRRITQTHIYYEKLLRDLNNASAAKLDSFFTVRYPK